MKAETLFSLVSGKSLVVSEPVGGRRPEWTLVEAGFGASYLHSPYFLAFLYRHARDSSVYERLRRKLAEETERLAWEQRWKLKVNGGQYLDGLVELVLAEEWMSVVDRQRLLDRLHQRWTVEVYERQIARKHRSIAAVLDRWCQTASEHIGRRIRNDDADYVDGDMEAVL